MLCDCVLFSQTNFFRSQSTHNFFNIILTVSFLIIRWLWWMIINDCQIRAISELTNSSRKSTSFAPHYLNNYSRSNDLALIHYFFVETFFRSQVLTRVFFFVHWALRTKTKTLKLSPSKSRFRVPVGIRLKRKTHTSVKRFGSCLRHNNSLVLISQPPHYTVLICIIK